MRPDLAPSAEPEESERFALQRRPHSCAATPVALCLVTFLVAPLVAALCACAAGDAPFASGEPDAGAPQDGGSSAPGLSPDSASDANGSAPPDGGATRDASDGTDADDGGPSIHPSPDGATEPSDATTAGATDAGAESGGDGASSTASDGSSGETDAASGSDAGATVAPCGGSYCRDGQTCVQGACAYASCSGSQVPGDYASVQDAVTALEAVGGTICLAAQTFNENVQVDLQADLTIQGVSVAQTTVSSFNVTVPLGAVTNTLAIQGLTTSSGSKVTVPAAVSGGGSVAFTNCALSAGTTASALSITVPNVTTGTGGSTSHVTVDVLASSLLGAGSPGAQAILTSDSLGTSVGLVLDGDDLSAENIVVNGDFVSAWSTMAVQNSYVHGADVGVLINQAMSDPNAAWATVVNNTFEGNQMAFEFTEFGTETLACLFFNNLFDDNQTAIDVEGEIPAANFGNNALWGNTTNYSGLATAGSGYVTANPLLDTSLTPPGLEPGSPCWGAGSATYAPPTDYWGVPRGTSVAIGAVQAY